MKELFPNDDDTVVDGDGDDGEGDNDDSTGCESAEC